MSQQTQITHKINTLKIKMEIKKEYLEILSSKDANTFLSAKEFENCLHEKERIRYS